MLRREFRRVRLPILEVAPSWIEGLLFWGRSTDPSHPWLSFPSSKIQRQGEFRPVRRSGKRIRDASKKRSQTGAFGSDLIAPLGRSGVRDPGYRGSTGVTDPGYRGSTGVTDPGCRENVQLCR
jgi:hypothetical protein